MTKAEGIRQMDNIRNHLLNEYMSLEALYSQASHPIAPEVQAKAQEIINASVSVTCMALNYKELPPEAKKPFAALLYAAADALSEKEE
ncbi:MAG: hypothetical protein J5966_07145 [Lachnospiraceae bacterium]|nr:hypothetical protein [Lachnospiraceae bacterium]